MTDEKVARAYRHYDTAKLALQVTAVLLLLGLGAFQVWQGQRAEEQRATGRQILNLVVECVIPPADRTPPAKVADPNNDCYTRGADRTGQAVSQIGDLSILAAACGAAHPGDVPATRDCVENAMENR